MTAGEQPALEAVQQRILWLAVRIVDHANHDRPSAPGDIKVGGHQASSASMVGIMTSLWFGHLSGNDKVAVKPHASPVYHAIKYLTGELDGRYLTELRALGGLQAYQQQLILTDGGPGYSSMMPGLVMYHEAFSYSRIGYASAIGFLMFLVILAVTYLNMRYVRSSAEYT